MTREPDFDELVGTEAGDVERERLRHAHELLVQAGPPPELTPELHRTPSLETTPRQRRRNVKRRTMLLIAAAVSVAAAFAAGYAVADHRGGSPTTSSPRTLYLKGTPAAPQARATLEVWGAQAGNWPMTISVVGLPRLARHAYYEVYLVRDGRPWGSCGTFVVSKPAESLTLTLNAPYALRKGDSWIVTRTSPGGEPGKTVLRAVSA